MDREHIIETLLELLKVESSVHALWLEGADATDSVDIYSDIDICAAINESAVDMIFEKIQKKLSVDSVYENQFNDTERQLVFHIAGTDKYHVVDFNAYFLGRANTTFIRGDKIDARKILFDKDNVIQYRDFDPDEGESFRKYWEKESAYRFSQISRVEKYCLRNQYPEAFVYYHKYVIEPLVYTLRNKYTPTKMWYYMVHISNHIPEIELEKLNRILQISCCEDIQRNLSFAEKWYHELKNM